MKKVTAAFLSITLIFSLASCSKKSESETTSHVTEDTSVTTTTSATTSVTESTTVTTTSSITETTETEPSSTAAVPRSADIADLCELMKTLTGSRIAYAEALVEEYYEKKFDKSYNAIEIFYGDDPRGETINHCYYYMQALKGDYAFNRFIFDANDEYGNVYIVEFVNSNSSEDLSLTPSDFSQEEMRQYYSQLEKDLTTYLGAATDSTPLDDKELWKPAYSEYDIGGGCSFKVEYRSSAGTDTVSIKFINSAERKHFLEPGEGMGHDGDNDLYFKEVGEGDVVTDEKTGEKYVKNQLLISCDAGTPNAKEKIEKICQQIDAEIVGHIEIVNDFQIEFHRDMTREELLDLAKKLEEDYYYISSVNLNYIVETGIDETD